jgi:hypothetical protein
VIERGSSVNWLENIPISPNAINQTRNTKHETPNTNHKEETMKAILSHISLVALAGLAPALALGDEPVRQFRLEIKQAQPRAQVLKVFDAEAERLSKFWIGVGCEPAGDALKAQLGLEHGLVVQSVGDDTPAAKAGIRQHDVLLQFGEQKLAGLDDLIAAVDKSEGKPAAVKLLRGGKQQEVEVTPSQRPDVRYTAPPEDHLRLWQKFIPNLKVDEFDLELQLPQGGAGPLRMLNIHPGIVLQGGAAKLPENLTVIVTKHGESPAEITVKQGEKSWSVSEDKLDELPDEVRDDVKRYLGRGGHARMLWKATPQQAPVAPKPAEAPEKPDQAKPQTAPSIRLRALQLGEEGVLRQQLEEMIKRLEELRGRVRGDDALDEIREELKSLRRDVDELRKRDEK